MPVLSFKTVIIVLITFCFAIIRESFFDADTKIQSVVIEL